MTCLLTERKLPFRTWRYRFRYFVSFWERSIHSRDVLDHRSIRFHWLCTFTTPLNGLEISGVIRALGQANMDRSTDPSLILSLNLQTEALHFRCQCLNCVQSWRSNQENPPLSSQKSWEDCWTWAWSWIRPPGSTLKHRHILGEYFLKESWANKIKVSPDSKANVFPNLGEWDISWLERLPLLLEFVRKADAPTLLGDAIPHFLGDIPAHEVSCAFFTPLLSHFLQNGLQNWGCGITFACK